MKNNIIIFLTIIIIILYIIGNQEISEDYISISDDKLSEFSYGLDDSSKIPNIIWTFWDGELTDTVTKCVDSWRYYNPNYQIIIINRINYFQYTDDNIDAIKHSADSMARYSDYIRLAILSKYGGFWIDASIICHHPFSWVHKIQNKLDVETIGYYIDISTKDEYKEYSPVIESWFFACIPESNFVCDWKNEFFSTKNFDTIDDYIENIKYQEVSFQNIFYINYLAIHISAQKLLQKNIGKYNIYLFSACLGPFIYLCESNWDSHMGMSNLTRNNTCNEYYKYPFIKLRGSERYLLDIDNNKDNAFSHLFTNK
jgi:hypothetical protein